MQFFFALLASFVVIFMDTNIDAIKEVIQTRNLDFTRHHSSNKLSSQLSANTTCAIAAIDHIIQRLNGTISDNVSVTVTLKNVLIVLPLVFLMISIAFGNSLVVVAVSTQRALRTPPNIIISSLAVADLTVGLFIIPLNMGETVVGGPYQYWHYGKALCWIWLTVDIILCSTSILHISAIAIDRYRCIHEGISYTSRRTAKTAISTCVSLWVIAIWIASAPALGWNDWAGLSEYECRLPNNWGYILHATLGGFFAPAALTVVVYVKIFLTIKRSLKERHKLTSHTSVQPQPIGGGDKVEMVEKDNINSVGKCASHDRRIKPKFKFSLAKEKKAVKTLGIIIGAFAVCWMPFSITILMYGFAGEQFVNIHFYRFATWLGYTNSALNPIIYSLFNQQFRKSFKKLLRIRNRNNTWRPTN